MRYRKHIVGLGVASAGLFVAGIGFAAWTATGDGNGSAASRSAVDIVVEEATITGDLYPAATATGKFKVTLTNPNPYAVTITTIGSGVADESHNATTSADTTDDCAALVSYAGETGLSISLAANGGTATHTSASNTVTLDHDAEDVCQNNVFRIPVTVSGAQD